MISNYGIYNNHELDNTLLVLSSETKPNRSENKGEIDILYQDDKIVGYKIKNFIRYAKIKYSGIIYLPANPLIDVINLVLERYNLETLDYKHGSGYITKRNNDKLMVYCLPGTFMRDYQISKGQYCSYYDLYIKDENDQRLFEIDETIKEGVDFFLSEVK
jgi:hypothetical protein